MTLDELKEEIHTDFALNKMPDYMKGADTVLFLLAKPLWAVEYGKEAENFTAIAYELAVILPASRFFTIQGGRYLELYQHAITTSGRPLTQFLRRAKALAKQQAGMLDLAGYAEALNEQ